ncbi:MAG TPA: glycosyltransferase [Rhodopila sp.]|jgi:GT2 family glycosyltransferase|nr:glycosyltransferase [Rhodopila sp.]
MTLNIAVGIPTIGRAAILRETLAELARQTRRPDQVIVCGARAEDVAGAADAYPNTVVQLAEPGLPRQRNAVIDAAAQADIVMFFDDDFLPDPAYLAEIERHMAADPSIVVATGLVLADGIKGAGLTAAEGRAILARHAASGDARHAASGDTRHAASGDRDPARVRPVFAGYGCNMAVRLAPMRAHALRFDERLPLYGWQEDVDLSCRLATFGRVVQIDAACGVHLGVKSGRGSGLRLGYSQVANPLYLCGKRLGYPLPRALEHIVRNMAMNLLRAARPEPYVDRRGRLRGNFLALRDLTRRRMAPERILDL